MIWPMLKASTKKPRSSSTTVEVTAEAHVKVLGLFQRIREAGFQPPPLRAFVEQAVINELPRVEKHYGISPAA